MFSCSKKTKIIQFQNVFFVDDIRRNSFWPAKEFFYDLLRVPASEVFGEAPGQSLRQMISAERNRLLFSSLLSSSSCDDTSWSAGYEKIDEDFAACLQEVIGNNVLIAGYELTPGLINFFDENGIPWVDIRISPIRFLPDLLIAVRTSLPYAQNELADYSIRSSEIRNVSGQLLAAARYREHCKLMQYNDDTTKFPVTYVIGQTPYDASLIRDGHFIRLSDYEDQLTNLLRNKEVIYLPHPSAPAWHQEADCEFLSRITEKFCVSEITLYDAFCSAGDPQFIGLSSGSLQEAAFFGCKTIMLHQSVCPLRYQDSDTENLSAYWQIPFQIFSDPDFFRILLGSKPDTPRIPLNYIRSNTLRRLHDVWWGYAEVAGRPNGLTAVQQRFLTEEVRLLKQQLSQTIALFLKVPDYISDRYVGLYDKKYCWLNDTFVTFMSDGRVQRDGVSEGKWCELSKASSSREIYLVWNEGGWIDKVVGNPEWTQLQCTNNIGHHFVVEALMP
ncbi:hypothetical protein [Acetobacter thailandicus]|uniref:hypothetical protein n=1 Tax=Acetobacter thailandicus TaxID=1502842 RepID=UPI001BA61182|nr:hypothetical protein [Acetobacter thailandicus]MBS1004635.1 hypothetical protein [Acetobacter thailandicus]